MNSSRAVKRKAEELDEHFIKIATNCAFCDQTLLNNKDSVKKSKLLDCLHTVCDNCVAAWDSDEKSCPKCDLSVHKKKLLDHKILEELVESDDDPNKVYCAMHKTHIASHWCKQCTDYICETCFGNHQQLKVTLDHEIVAKMDHWEHRDVTQDTFPCSIHPKEQLVIFCTKCNVMTCRDCQLATHREHSYEFVEKVIDQAKKDIYDMFKFIAHHQMVLNQAQNLITERKTKLIMRKDSLVKEINVFSTALMELINKRSQYLINRLEQMTSNKIDVYDTNSAMLKKHQQPFDHTIHFVDNVLHSSSDPSIIFSKDQILSHMKRIHFQKSTIPNVVRNLQLKFSSGDITILMKELQNFGSISMNDEEGCSTAMEKAAASLSKQLRLALNKQYSTFLVPQSQSPLQQQQIQTIQTEASSVVSTPTFVQTTLNQSTVPRIQAIAEAKIAFPVSQWTSQPQKGAQVSNINRMMVPPFPSRIIQPGPRETSLVVMNQPNNNLAALPQRVKLSWHTPESAQTRNVPPSVTINKVNRLPEISQEALNVALSLNTTVASEENPPADTISSTSSTSTLEGTDAVTSNKKDILNKTDTEESTNAN